MKVARRRLATTINDGQILGAKTRLERVTPSITIVRSAKRTRFRFESVTPNKALTIQAHGLPGLGKLEIKVRPGEKLSVVFPPKS